MSDKKVCEVCGREKWEYSGPARTPTNCMAAFDWPRDAAFLANLAEHWRLGYQRKAAILTPEVLRLIEAARAFRNEYDETGALLPDGVVSACFALPSEKPVDSNHTEKQQLPRKG